MKSINKFSTVLRQLRNEKNVSQKNLADFLKYSQACVSQWENGEREPSLDDLINIAQYFSVSVGYLLGVETL